MIVSFDWKTFLETYSIFYRTEGPNCASGNVVIKCPLCGEDDPSEHLGINLETGAWGCWRDSTHRGRSQERLVQLLIGCNPSTARSIVGKPVQNLSKFDQLFETLKSEDKITRELCFPDEFKSIYENSRFPSAKKYLDYLQYRGFEAGDTVNVCKYYNLQYSISSKNWNGRLIFPIYLDKKLATWTGRAISRRSEIRYLSLSHKPSSSEKRYDPIAPFNIKDTLWNFDNLKYGGKILYLVEGPLDALKLDFYAKRFNVRSTCLFNNQISEKQIELVYRIRSKFKEVRLLLDEETLNSSLKIESKLNGILSRIDFLPKSVKDPGEMKKHQVEEFIYDNSIS